MSIRREGWSAAAAEQATDVIARLHESLQAANCDRRSFLQGLTLLFSVTRISPLYAEAGKPTSSLSGMVNVPAVYSTDPWLTLYVVQSHLLPSDTDSPGAVEINATAYLKSTLADPLMNPESREFILNGVGWLNDTSQQSHQAGFANLAEAAREDTLQSIARSREGERWLSLLLLYIFEALLSDPIYGGNPGGIGWKWLEHKPGFPQPDSNRTYQHLTND